MSVKAIIYISVIAFLFLFSGFFSGTDMAFSSVNTRRLKAAMDQGSKTAKLAYRYATDFDNTIITILFGNNLVNILASSLAAVLVLEIPFSQDPIWETVIPGIMLLLLLTFGEIIPKAIARAYNYRVCLLSAYAIRFFEIIFFPFARGVNAFCMLLTKPLSRHAEKVESQVATDEELQAMIDDIEDEGIIDESQSELISNSIEFKDTCAYEVMTPRVRIEGIAADESLDRFILKKDAFRYSRLPVYEKSLDNIIGYIPAKSLQKAILMGKKLSIKDLMLPILEVPRTCEISFILKQMKRAHHHIAVVKDEYGGTEGIITLEDILEELVGEMWDESDLVQEEVVKTEKRYVYMVRGSMDVEEFFERFKLDTDLLDEDYETLSGWINDHLGRFARKGDVIDYQRVTIRVKKVTAYTVDLAEITYHPRRKV